MHFVTEGDTYLQNSSNQKRSFYFRKSKSKFSFRDPEGLLNLR